MKAILYRTSTNKIINVAPITINQQQNLTQGVTQKNPATAVHKHTVTYYNGTSIVGVATAMEKNVNSTYDHYSTKAITNASRNNYTGTLVVDISGTHSEEAAQLAKLLGGKVGALPSGEITPDSDLLVISGQ